MIENFEILKEELDLTVRHNILRYWIDNAVDEKNGGFIGQIDSNNVKDIEANKGVVLNSRILWTFSLAYRKLGDASYKVLADRAYDYIVNHFVDKKYEGVYWELDYLGNPIQRKKQIYAQAFTIYALTEYYKTDKNKDVLNLAIALFELIETHSFDSQNLGYVEAFSEDWSALEDMRLSDKDVNLEKTMNTHLHILEAYTNLYRVWPNQELKVQQEKLITLFLNKFINKDNHLDLFFSNDWKNNGTIISFGHDIECAWLLTEAAQVIGNKELVLEVERRSVEISSKFIDNAIEEDGGILNEVNVESGHVDYDKHWWQHAEALVGLMNAYEISKDEKFITPLFAIWKFIKTHFIDYQNGEWFWKINKEGIPDKSQEKIGFWKCPYHNSRACFEMIDRINQLKTAS